MKATLIKEKEGVYSLLDGNRFISTTECKEGTPNKLSIKNCEAIANGYDLDDIVENHPLEISNYSHSCGLEQGIIYGFQKALSILGDKKFSEDDMKNGIEYGIQSVLQAVPGVTSAQSVLDSYKQSLQQTEWDVDIVMEKEVGTKLHDDGREFFIIDGTKPKLDANGCLILKRI